MKPSRFKAAKVRPRHQPGTMNKTEAAYAQYLDVLKAAGEVLEWAFEPLKLRLASATWYSIDFLLQLPDGSLQAHEVKGATRKKSGKAGELWEEDARIKFKVAAEQHPWLAFFSVRPAIGAEGKGWIVTPLREEKVA